MNDAILVAKDISKDFPGVKALNKVSFEVKAGEVHALCGENGAGKSTLMHIFAGVFGKDEGEIILDGEPIEIQSQRNANELGIAIVYQERSLVSQLSVAENIFAGRQPVLRLGHVDSGKMNAQSKELLDNLGMRIDPKALVVSLSPPEQQMVEIAKALSINPKILIFDEPTSAITDAEVVALFAMIKLLRERGIAIIYISHRLSEVFEIADRVTVLKDGEYVATEEVSKVDTNWLINKMVGRDLIFAREEREIADQPVLEVENISGERFSNISFKVNKGEIISFAGLAGAGRTEVMKAVFGADRIYEGRIKVDGKEIRISSPIDAIKAGIGYLPEDRKEQGLFLEMSVTENIASASLDRFKKGIHIIRKQMRTVAIEFRDKLRIITPSIKQKTINLSGGNQQKVVIAKWLLVNPRILIVDEPTRGIDIGSKAEIYSILRTLAAGGTAIVVVSSELPEVLSISDRIYVMCSGKISGEFLGREATEPQVMKYAYGHGEDDLDD